MAKIVIIPAFKFLFEGQFRYRVCYGGRGKGASWNYVRGLLIHAMKRKVRILCVREIQKSIAASTHQLIEDQIDKLGLRPIFNVGKESIVCTETGSEFIFEGLSRNVAKIKSLEGIDICDVEEAESVTDESWDLLLPTIRKDDSEIWIRFNTRYADDPTYDRFVLHPPADAIVRKVNFDQNPHFNEVLRKEMEGDVAFRPTTVANKWHGEPLGAGRKVWPDFKEHIHVKIVPWEDLIGKANFFMAMDPAMHYYPACIWGALMPTFDGGTHVHLYNEWPTRADLGDTFAKARKTIPFTGSLRDQARQIYDYDGSAQHGIKITARFIDTRFAKGSGSGTFFSGSTQGIVSEFAKAENGRLEFRCPYEKKIDAQRSRIHQYLQYNELQPIGPMNEPRLTVAPWCENMIESLKFHRLEMDSEAESQNYKDMSDALRILFAGLEDCPWKDPEKQRVGKIYEDPISRTEDSWMH